MKFITNHQNDAWSVCNYLFLEVIERFESLDKLYF